MTFSEIVQLLDAGMAAPESDTTPEPAEAVPVQVVERPLGVATERPVGRVSVKATPVNATAFATGLVMVSVSEVTPLGGMLEAPKALEMEGGATMVILEVLLTEPVPPLVEVMAPVVLF